MSDQQNYETQLYHRMCDKLWSVVTPRDGMDCASIAAAELTRLREENAKLREQLERAWERLEGQ